MTTNSKDPQELLAPYIVDDAEVALAYEAVTPNIRAVLKTSIARMYSCFGEVPTCVTAKQMNENGERFCQAVEPAPFTFVVCPASYSYATAFLSAVMCAVLAKVPRIIPCFITDAFLLAARDNALAYRRAAHQQTPLAKDTALPATSVVAPQLLACADLIGLPEVFVMPQQQIASVCAAFAAYYGVGRLVMLGETMWGEDTITAAHHMGVPCVSLFRPPAYAANVTPANLLDTEASNYSCMRMNAAEDGVWIWPELTPYWMMNNTLLLG